MSWKVMLHAIRANLEMVDFTYYKLRGDFSEAAAADVKCFSASVWRLEFSSGK